MLCPRFSVSFSILIISLREERVGLRASRTFVCLFCACMFYPFSLPLGVEGWLRFVIVAYPGTFYLLFRRYQYEEGLASRIKGDNNKQS